ncbi:MAG: VCBS repeat-containing protein [Bacteroidetes bacterium]|nr:VCBS repeat-containing protein [Bacteroidota bacterium]
MVKSTLRKSMLLTSTCLIGVLGMNAQFSFTNKNSLTPTATHSGNSITVVDVNNDGLDDIVKMDQASDLVVQLQNINGTFTHYNLGDVGAGNVWGMAVADVDHNGWKDVATGAGSTSLVKLFWSGSTITTTTTVLSGSYFVQNITFGDIDNDGWVDLAVCDDNDYMKIYKNNAGTMTLTTALIDTEINPGMTYGGDPYDSGNYGSVWLDIDNDGDLDLYIAHCRQSASSSNDQRRRDRLFRNNGAGGFVEDAAATGLEAVGNYKQTWTSSFGDLDNDGDQDVVLTNHGENSQIFSNNGSGVFTDVTAGSGFSTSFDAIESFVEDFDNDGWLDILISGPGLRLYKNNHDGTYTQATNAFGGAMTTFLSFAAGDLNHDGFIDLVSSYGNVYNTPTATDDVLWMNDGNSNNFITFHLTGTTSNDGAIGAKVIITGSFGTQVREVRAGESYGTENSFDLHFGLGSDASITSATIEWPSGLTNTFGTLSAGQFVTVIEGGCSITNNVIPGPHSFCTGGSVSLNAPAGYTSYLWSNGATTPSISVAATGNYYVVVTNAAGCTNLSPLITVTMNPDETPSVVTSGSNSCGGTLALTSTSATAYSWTGPSGFTATTQTINPLISGTYNLTTTGLCQTWTAPPTSVTVFASPASPTGTGTAGIGPISLNLSAAGAGGTINWYTASTGGTSVGTGTSYSTPVISTTTTYYIDETNVYPGAIGYTGQPDHTGSSLYSTGATTNGSVDFDVIGACTLQTVKVYTNTAGVRQILLQDASLTTINSLTINLPADTTIITLNFALTPGTGYHLTTDGATNTTSFGSTNPKMQRSASAVAYPYTLAGFVSLTGSNQGPLYYYYFYDWKIEGAPINCSSSPRVPVVATITGTTGISAIDENNGVVIYPNPASSEVNVTFNYGMNSTTVIEITDVMGRLVKTASVQDPMQGQTIQLDVNELNAGTYFIAIRNENNKLVSKLTLTK